MGILRLAIDDLAPSGRKQLPNAKACILHARTAFQLLWGGIPDMGGKLRVKREQLTELKPTGHSGEGHGSGDA